MKVESWCALVTARNDICGRCNYFELAFSIKDQRHIKTQCRIKWILSMLYSFVRSGVVLQRIVLYYACLLIYKIIIQFCVERRPTTLWDFRE